MFDRGDIWAMQEEDCIIQRVRAFVQTYRVENGGSLTKLVEGREYSGQ